MPRRAPRVPGTKNLNLRNPQWRPGQNAVLLLALIVLGNVLLAFPAAGNLAFLAPVSIAAFRGGLRNGLPVFILTTVAATMCLAYSGLMQHGGLLNNVIIEAVLLTGAMIVSDQTRRNLRETVNRTKIDELTSALNRSSIAESGMQAVRASLASGEPMTVAVLDLDDFKELNDGHGHAFGDAVLIELVKTLRSNLGPEDMVGRTGGDEFVVVMPNRTADDSREILRRTNDAFSDRTFVSGYPVSFSYGIGSPIVNGYTWATLLHSADQDMYRRKAAKKRQPVARAVMYAGDRSS
jgi:diguanylate cyclase (GGDEF)-like protein